LTSADLTAQADRWRQLRSQAQLDQRVTEDGVRLEFTNTADHDAELRALVAVENECWAWANWSVSQPDGWLVLEVRSVADGGAALHAMFI
jgi:hypothetical protein